MSVRKCVGWRCAAAALLLAAALPAAAHDSWFAAGPATAGRGTQLALGTGNRYPVAESGSAAASLAHAACVDGAGRRHALRPLEETPRALKLRSRVAGAVACWAELKDHEVTLAPPLVEVYFREIRPSDEMRALWSEQLERGLEWTERYRKFARIEHGAQSADPAALRKLREPVGMPLEIVIEGDAPLRAGEAAAFRVLADGLPVAGLAVELVSERSPIGIWSRSDAQGRLQHRLPFGGGWLLRATWVEPEAEPGRWRSRFVTLAFEAS